MHFLPWQIILILCMWCCRLEQLVENMAISFFIRNYLSLRFVLRIEALKCGGEYLRDWFLHWFIMMTFCLQVRGLLWKFVEKNTQFCVNNQGSSFKTSGEIFESKCKKSMKLSESLILYWHFKLNFCQC